MNKKNLLFTAITEAASKEMLFKEKEAPYADESICITYYTLAGVHFRHELLQKHSHYKTLL